MRKIFWFISIVSLLAAAASVFAQSVVQGGGTVFTVSGNVSADGLGVSNATVVLLINSGVVESTTTDSSGNYVMNAIGGNSYIATAYKEGYNFDPAYQGIGTIKSNQIINFQNGIRLCEPAPIGQTGANFCTNASQTNSSQIENGRIAYEVFGTSFAVNADGSGQAQLPPGGAFPSWSPAGNRLLYNRDPSTDVGFDQELFVMNADGSSNIQLTDNIWSDYRASFSPDETRIVFDRLVNTSDWGIYTMNADGSNQTRLTPTDVIATDASFSPNGTKIVYSSGEISTGGFEIFVMNADGTGRTQLTTSGTGFTSIEPSWSPDGLFIVFSSDRLGLGYQIWQLNTIDSSLLQLTDEDGLSHRSPVYSPDGTKIAFSRNTSEQGFQEIYSKPIFGGIPQRLSFTFSLSNAESPSWQRVLGDVPITTNEGVSIRFVNVTTPGNTVTTPITSASTGAIPLGFGPLSPNIAFDVRTSATFTGEIELCFNASSVNDEDVFNTLVVFHNENGGLVDRTSSRNFPTRSICATVTSLSPFVVAAPAAPTAANVYVSGRVIDTSGRGLSRVSVVLTDGAGTTRSARSSSLGYYRFDDVESGQTYVLSARSKNHSFQLRTVTVSDNIEDVDLIANQ